MSALLLHQRFINFRPQKQDADTQVQPQHHQNHGGQAPVHVREIAEMIKINREQLRRSDPAYRGEHRSRKLAPGRQFLMGQVGVEPREKQHQHGQRKQRAEADNVGGNRRDKREVKRDKALQHAAEHQKAQRHDADRQENDRVKAAHDPAGHVPAAYIVPEHPVEAPLDAEHSLGGSPQGDDGRDGEHGLRRVGVDVLDDVEHQRVDDIRRQRQDGSLQVRLADGRDQLNDRQKHHDEREEGQYDKEGGLRGVDGHLICGEFVGDPSAGCEE